MSSLDRMSIFGVRSFSPEVQQSITFCSPLTLILGPNGTGKTTIIECLRYVTTGDYPPNSERGGAFIHDPKLAGEREVKGQIRLRFTDTIGVETVTTRGMEGQQKLKRLQVRSLESTISRKNDQGEKISISSKCTEVDREMVSMLGVSKAILNNVIFCHQEDSNWPLSEGKSLKEKFDDIFAATRYVKALENLHSIRSKHDTDAKMFMNDLRHVESCRIQAAKMKADLQRSEDRLSSSYEKIQKLTEALAPIQNSLADVKGKERIISSVQSDLDIRRTEYDLGKKACDELKRQIKNEFVGSAEDLRMEIHNFETQLENKKEEKAKAERHIKQLENEMKENTTKYNSILIQLGKLNTESKKHSEEIDARDKAARNLHSEYELTVRVSSEGELSAGEFDQINSHLKEKFQSMGRDEEKKTKEFVEQEKGLQTQLDSLNESKSRLLQTKEIRSQQIVVNEKEISGLDRKLKEIKSSVEKLANVELAHKKKESELLSVSKDLNVDAAGKEIESFENKIRKFDDQVRHLDDEMLELNKQAGIRAELDVAKKDKKTKEEAIKKLKSKHEDTLIHLLGEIPSDNIRIAVERFALKLKQDIAECQKKQGDLKVDLARLETNRKTEKEELTKKERELRENEDQMFLCGSRDLETAINQLETLIRNLHDEKGSSIGAQYLYNTFIEKLKRKDPCCPLCHREFSEPQDVEELVNELDTKLRLLPSELESKQRNIEEQQKKCSKLSSMRPVRLQIEKLSEEIPSLKTNLKNYENQIEKCRTELADVDESLEVKQTDESAATSMSKDLVLLENHISDLKKVEKTIADAEVKLGTVGDRTVDGVNAEKTEIQTQLAELHSSLKEKQKILKDYMNLKNRLQTEVNELGAQLVKIKMDAQTTSELQNRRKQLDTEISNCKSEISNITEQLAPIQRQLEDVANKKEALIKQKEDVIKKCQRQRQKLKEKIDEMTGHHINITKYMQNRGNERLTFCLEESEKMAKVIKKAGELKQQLNSDWQKFSTEIDGHQTRLREFQDCLSLKEKESSLERLTKDIAELKSKLGGFDLVTLAKEKSLLTTKEEKLNREINLERGKHAGLEEEIKRQKDDLRGELYRDVDKKYTEKLVELKTTKVASSDLHKYYLALDSAIMQYHAMKMTEINKIIRDLWGRTYKGNDIDYIEIRSETSEPRAASSKRQYNYKVVMIKGDVEQVMRGRCSAGQKVLASLLIRLALAETFCLNCGIMALDEPTTNLDKENIDSLCDALAEIVQMRSTERQFQLIVISHDEDFVARLGRTASAEYYHRLEKDDRGHSTITRYSLQQSQISY